MRTAKLSAIAAKITKLASAILLLRKMTGLPASATAYDAISRIGWPARAAIRRESFFGRKNV
jgi:hypothetical protein